MPRYSDLDWRGLDYSEEEFNQLMKVDRDDWQAEIAAHDELFIRLYDRLPKEFIFLRELILSALWRSPEEWGMAPERPAMTAELH